MDLFEKTNTHATDPETSTEAALSHKAKAKTNRENVLACFREADPVPLSSEQVADRLGIEYIEVARRVSDLGMKREQRLRPSGSTRPNRNGKPATLWKLNPEPFDADHATRLKLASKRARLLQLELDIEKLERKLARSWS